MKPRSAGESENVLISIGDIIALALPKSTEIKYPSPNGINSLRKSGERRDIFLSCKINTPDRVLKSLTL